ncbi:uncharacterized protein BDZ99DRAFT_559499 [Mytilinidion resinicola]|uniref:Uncharacterized protein n=1 Tax=Mytilinidion resinicola TaxID=574789 RepID=A0A6A6YSG1_9PEZI|nr:uncharacterized protein BDZ99DRAFT_559499 [Mytilinidion resinicola]KAF2811488.1 hypothetical protein BDZ99DRAFT_559499 [Mytilinidion resinicola]
MPGGLNHNAQFGHYGPMPTYSSLSSNFFPRSKEPRKSEAAMLSSHLNAFDWPVQSPPQTLPFNSFGFRAFKILGPYTVIPFVPTLKVPFIINAMEQTRACRSKLTRGIPDPHSIVLPSHEYVASGTAVEREAPRNNETSGRTNAESLLSTSSRALIDNDQSMFENLEIPELENVDWFMDSNPWPEISSQSCAAVETPILPLPQTTATESRPFLQQEQATSIITPASNPFLLHANHLSLQSYSFLSATLALAASMNISDSEYLTDAPSPFYQPTPTPPSPSVKPSNSSSHSGSQASVQVYPPIRYHDLKADLRPTQLQLATPHASYLDLIIFPLLRSTLLTYITQPTDAPCAVKFDINELLVDMMEGGLRCWGNANLAKGEPRGGAGCPWDMRSWEASRAFCSKWWFLVGGEEGEVWRTSSEYRMSEETSDM